MRTNALERVRIEEPDDAVDSRDFVPSLDTIQSAFHEMGVRLLRSRDSQYASIQWAPQPPDQYRRRALEHHLPPDWVGEESKGTGNWFRCWRQTATQAELRRSWNRLEWTERVRRIVPGSTRPTCSAPFVGPRFPMSANVR